MMASSGRVYLRADRNAVSHSVDYISPITSRCDERILVGADLLSYSENNCGFVNGSWIRFVIGERRIKKFQPPADSVQQILPLLCKNLLTIQCM